MSDEVNFDGFNECIKTLSTLDSQVFKASIRRAMRAGAKVIAAMMRSMAPNRTGATIAGIKVRSGKRSRNIISAIVGLFDGFYQGYQFYAGFVNYGWLTGKRGSKHRTKIPGEHWAEIAFDEAEEQALATVTNTLSDEIDKAMVK